MKRIAIIVPMFNEVANILAFYQEIDRVCAQLPNYAFEYLFVDDGSSDGTIAAAETLSQNDPRVTIIELSRNFGKEAAVTAGILNLDHDAAIIMDADLQHPPAYIPQLVAEWEKGFEIVSTLRIHSENQPFIRKVGSHFFYKAMNLISDTKMQSKTTDFRLLDRIVIETLKTFTERNRMVRGIIDWVGFKKTTIDFVAPERFAGEVRYSYGKLIGLAVNSITSFSLTPLKISGYLGLVITLFSALLLAFMGVDKFCSNAFGFTNLAFIVVANTFAIGIVLMSIGLVALYVGNIHNEVLNRPLFIVRKTTRNTRK